MRIGGCNCLNGISNLSLGDVQIGNAMLPDGTTTVQLSGKSGGKGWYEVWLRGVRIGTLRPGGRNGIYVADGAPIPPDQAAAPPPPATVIPTQPPRVVSTPAPPTPITSRDYVVPQIQPAANVPSGDSGSYLVESAASSATGDEPIQDTVTVAPPATSNIPWGLILAGIAAATQLL